MALHSISNSTGIPDWFAEGILSEYLGCLGREEHHCTYNMDLRHMLLASYIIYGPYRLQPVVLMPYSDSIFFYLGLADCGADSAFSS